MIQLDQPIQKVHDLVAVSRQLASVDSDWEWDEENLSDLSSGAVMARYPGFETTADDAAELMGLAGRMRVRCWPCCHCVGEPRQPVELWPVARTVIACGLGQYEGRASQPLGRTASSPFGVINQPPLDLRRL